VFLAAVGVLIVGFNEVIGIGMVFFLLSIALIEYINNRKVHKYYLYLLLIVSIGFFFSIFAPGNIQRLSNFAEHGNASNALLLTTEGLGKIVAVIVTHPVFWVFLLMSYVYLPGYLKIWMAKNNYKFRKIVIIIPGMSMIYMFSVLFFLFMSLGDNVPLRVYNSLVMISIVLFMLNAGVFGLIAETISTLHRLGCKSNIHLICIVLCVVFLVFHWGRDVYNQRFYGGNNAWAWSDLVGEGNAYNRENIQRNALIKEAKRQNKGYLCLPALENKPRSIYFSDIEIYADDWKNIGLAQYWQLDSVKICKK